MSDFSNDFMTGRYSKNHNAISPEDGRVLQSKSVCVVGCGGLGGYIVEMLARLGVRDITVIDGDVFGVSNLNRQLYCDEQTLGRPKAVVAKERIVRVNSDVSVRAVPAFLTDKNCDELIEGRHIVVDALDNISTRRMLAARCAAKGIPLVHGAIRGWYAQITTILPGGRAFDTLYPAGKSDVANNDGNPAFTPALAASIQVAEVVKVLLNKGEILNGRLLLVDLLTQQYDLIEI